MSNYTVQIKTGNRNHGGTDADVFIIFIGTIGYSPEFELDNPGINDFEKGNLDTFSNLSTDDIGWINQIRLRHNDIGKHSGWDVDYVNIKNDTYNIEWRIPIYRWMAKDEGDKKIELYFDTIVKSPFDFINNRSTMTRNLIGWDAYHFGNNTSQVQSTLKKVTYDYDYGISYDYSSSYSHNNSGTRLPNGFLDSSCSYIISANNFIKEKLFYDTSIKKKYEEELSVTLPPHSSQTVIVLRFQNIIEGRINNGQVEIDYKIFDEFRVEQYFYDEILSNQAVQQIVDEIIGIIYEGEAFLSKHIKKDNVCIPIRKKNISRVNTGMIKKTRKDLNKNSLTPNLLKKFKLKIR